MFDFAAKLDKVSYRTPFPERWMILYMLKIGTAKSIGFDPHDFTLHWMPECYPLIVTTNILFLLQGQKKIDWHDNLKALLVRKAFLVYVTLAEAFYSEENYGQCVKLLKRALNCYFCFLKISDHAKGSLI